MTLYVYVDNSNLWIEGMRISAVRKGMAPSLGTAMDNKIVDTAWRYEFIKLYDLVCPPDSKVGRSALFGSLPPNNESMWERARQEGFEVELFQRNAANREKKVDSALGTMMIDTRSCT